MDLLFANWLVRCMALLKVQSITGQESFEVILKHLKSLVFMKPTTLKIKQMTLEFKSLHYIPYIIVQNTHSF